MHRFIIATYLFLTIFIGSTNEFSQIHIHDESDTVNSAHVGQDLAQEGDFSRDCEDDCHNDVGHCRHRCSAIHVFRVQDDVILFIARFKSDKKKLIQYNSHYKWPDLASSFRPPLYS